MGAEQSKYEGPPEVLQARDLASVAKYMKSSRCKNVFTMVSDRDPLIGRSGSDHLDAPGLHVLMTSSLPFASWVQVSSSSFVVLDVFGVEWMRASCSLGYAGS